MSLLKLIWTLLISIGVLYLAKAIGWIGFDSNLPVIVANTGWNIFCWMCIIAVIFTIVSAVCGQLYALVIIFTAGLGCFLAPVYIIGIGYLKLMAVGALLPGFLHTSIWWQVLLLSMFIGINASTPTKSSSSSS